MQTQQDLSSSPQEHFSQTLNTEAVIEQQSSPSMVTSLSASSTQSTSSDRNPQKYLPVLSWSKNLSIGIKATLLATLLGVFPVLAVGWLAYQAADDSITQRIAQEKQAEATQISDQVSRYLEERLANIKTISNITEHFIEADELKTTRTNSAERTEAEQELSEELTQFVQNYPTYVNITLYDLKGEPLVQSRGSARELNQAKAFYFQQVLESGNAVTSEPLESNMEGTKQFAIYVAAPVKDERGKTAAVVAAKIPVEYIGNAVLRNSLLQEGTIYRLIDASEKIFQNLPNTEGLSPGVAATQITPIFTEINASKERRIWIDQTTAKRQIHAYAPVNQNPKWSVVVSTDAEVAFRPQRQLFQAVILGTILTAFSTAAIGAIVARRATRPIQQVARTVEKLGQGELQTRIEVSGTDELAVLGNSVNQMAVRIQTLLETLQHNAEQLSHQNAVLSHLARNEAVIQGDAARAAQAFTEAIASTLNIERVEIWIYANDYTFLSCLDRFDQSTKQHSNGMMLELGDADEYLQLAKIGYPAHWDEIATNRTDLPAQPSALNVPVQVSGRIIGVIRCDALSSDRIWQAAEKTFVTSLANLFSLALESEFLQQEVSHLLDVVSEVEEGDLTIQAKVSDRTTGLVADTFNRLIERLTLVLTQVLKATQQVSDSANQQKSMAEVVANNTEKQAQAVNRVLQLTEQVEQAAQSSVEQVESSVTSLETMQTAVEQGQGAINELTVGIGVLQEGTDRIIQQMKTLGEFVGLADQFVQDQSQIASLTQTLALNASLVAARASEQRDPRQFAVVAREFDSIASQVSRLAQQTNEGLMTLEQRSTQIHGVVSIIDASIQNLGGLVRGFTQGVDQSDRVFTNIHTVVSEAVHAGEAITQSSQAIVDAAQTAAQVARDIADIAILTAELSQQTRTQSDEMDRLSNQLLQSVQFFQLPTLIVG
jgi:twitching motility protein PilJ